MSLRQNPEKAVSVLLDRLDMAKQHALKVVASTELCSEFDDIGTELKNMTGSFSKINLWEREKKLVDQLCVLEQDLGRFKDFQPQQLLQNKLSRVQQQVSEILTTLSATSDNQGGTAESEEWKNQKVEDKIVEIDAMLTLCTTFHCLKDSQLKMCSLCLSVFPEKALIKKRPLIYWWMGEGLVTAEDDGEKVFQELLHEGFIKPTNTRNSFVVYPWIRRMLIKLASDSDYLKFTNRALCDGLRREFLRPGNEGAKEENVLTVFNIDEKYLSITAEWLRGRKKVEVLQMGRWQDSANHHIEVEDYKELFNGLGSQKHLKYLSLRGISRIESLPHSIAKLVSLQILDLRACHNLEKLPNSIAELKNLTHLDVSECYLLENMPKGMEHLERLEVLKGFVVGGNGCRIGDLTRLQRLRKLGLRVRNEQLESLAHFKKLQILTISWGMETWDESKVSLPTTLKKLDLRCVPFTKVPEWMAAKKVPNLEKLYVRGGKLEKSSINDDVYPGAYVNLKYL